MNVRFAVPYAALLLAAVASQASAEVHEGVPDLREGERPGPHH